MKVTDVLLYSLVAWLGLFFVAYLFASKPVKQDSSAMGAGRGENILPGFAAELTDPFTSQFCQNLDFGNPSSKVGVVITARNEAKYDLIATVKSIQKNSGSPLHSIVIVDDQSTDDISSWKEWDQVRKNSVPLTVHRSKTRLGVSGGKSLGVSLLSKEAEVVAFVDAHVLVSSNWLLPLLHTLQKFPKSLVYPSLDILDFETQQVVRGGDVVGAFDWGMNFRWEDVTDSTRLRARMGDIVAKSYLETSEKVPPSDRVVYSPAAPGIFAMQRKYFNEIGGLDPELIPYGQESVELSLRVWLCGGSVLRQPCSRVAHDYINKNIDDILPNGVTSHQVTMNALTVAEHWLPDYRETVFMSRFLGRVPYKVEVALDASSPKFLYNVDVYREGQCSGFDWFLESIYPGLKADKTDVEQAYKRHLSSTQFGENLLAGEVRNIAGESNFKLDDQEIARLQARLDKPEIKDPMQKHTKQYAIPDPLESKRREYRSKPLFEKTDEVDQHEIHANKIREFLKCEDEDEGQQNSKCAKRTADGDCERDKYYMFFGCPKSCGLCATDGTICFDFYEKKCKEWKKDGVCEIWPEGMRHQCRFTCGFCNRAEKGAGLEEPKLKKPQDPIVDKTKPPEPKAAEVLPAKNGNVVLEKELFYVAQRNFASGQLPDVEIGNACTLNGKPHGQLLARVPLRQEFSTADASQTKKNLPRIFCAIYTMEKNHDTNVKATISTWGKRCDGFLAFSTATDESLPAIRIEHEGEESYQNMWQKSRSIWKFVGENLLDKFDFFLLGGDDMFYIVENLRAYLASEEIQGLVQTQPGTYLGRRFFPPKQQVFNSGGAGYVVDRKALQVLKDNLDTPKCFPHQKGFWEDVNVANCLRVSAKIVPYDTRDSQQRERFHPFTPGQHLTYRIPPGNEDWYPKYNPELKEGFDCCSDGSISFHYCTAQVLTELYAYYYHCPNKH